MNGNPGEVELSLKILKAATSKKVNILPSRSLSFSIAKEETVKDEKNNNHTIQLIGFSGLGGPPYYVWFTKEGNFFASLSDWTSIIQEGYEKNIDILLPIQKKFESDFLLLWLKLQQKKILAALPLKMLLFSMQRKEALLLMELY
jgi:hypothetical protein